MFIAICYITLLVNVNHTIGKSGNINIRFGNVRYIKHWDINLSHVPRRPQTQNTNIKLPQVGEPGSQCTAPSMCLHGAKRALDSNWSNVRGITEVIVGVRTWK